MLVVINGVPQRIKKQRKPVKKVEDDILEGYISDVSHILYEYPGLKALDIQKKLPGLTPCPFIYQVLYFMRDENYIYSVEAPREPGKRGRLGQLWYLNS